jgi:N-acetylglucosamine repressor
MLPSGITSRVDLLPPESGETPAARTSGKRQIRRNQILNVLRQHGAVSRVEIARILNFNFRTVSNLVDEMVADGLASEQEAKKTALGRRPIPVSLNAKSASVLGIDVGKSSVIALMTDLSGEVIGRFERPSPLPTDASKLASWIEGFIGEALKGISSPIPPIAGIGIALPGLIHSAESATRLLKPEAETIRAQLQHLFGVPVIVDNDARVMALGQLWFGQGSKGSNNHPKEQSDLSTFAMVNIGYGLGLGVVIKRNLYPGFHGHAGEIGHVRLGEPGVPCHCGGDSCLENLASGSGIERMAAIAKLQVNGRPATAAEVAEMARGGQKNAHTRSGHRARC